MTSISIEKIGIIGGGISAALLCLEAKKKGLKTTIVDPDINCLASKIADEHLVSSLDKNILLKISHRTDVIVFTKKLENISDYDILIKEKAIVYPQVEVLETLSSRELFLETMDERDIPVANYKKLKDELEVIEFLKDAELPISMTKHYHSESDKILLLSNDDIVDLLIEVDKPADYWLVEELPIESVELSIGVTRDIKNKMHTYSVTEDIYDGSSWVQSYVPARITKTLQTKAIALAKRAIRSLGATGTFTVNISVSKEKKLTVRDIHPYALENAAYTLESCDISQYDHLIRTILGLPLYSSTFQGVTFCHLENGALLNDPSSITNILAYQGTNVYSFKGKDKDQTMSLYTFKANSWEELEENIKI